MSTKDVIMVLCISMMVFVWLMTVTVVTHISTKTCLQYGGKITAGRVCRMAQF